MNFKFCSIVLLSLLALSFFFVPGVSATSPRQDQPVVHAILFYSPTCGHCQQVITEDLPPLIEKYGNQLQIMGVNVTSTDGQNLYQQFIESWNIPEEKLGVPTLVIGDIYLVGSADIPAQFPGLIEGNLNNGGIDWPDIPGLEEIIQQADRQEAQLSAETPQPTIEQVTSTADDKIIATEQVDQSPTSLPLENDISQPLLDSQSSTSFSTDLEITLADRFRQDLVGNTLAVVTLVAMVVSVVVVITRILTPTQRISQIQPWLIPALSLLGIFVATYLTFVEVTGNEAVCGPIGNCNAVQESPYAVLFGILPVGVLGLLGYIAILLAWFLQRFGPRRWQDILTLSMWGMSLFGVLFSIYLTYLEPFVIGATCMWCISSALIITMILWITTEPVRQIWFEQE